MFQVRLLGQFDVRADGKRVLVPSRSGQSLFAFLVLHAGTEHRREKLAGMLWPDVSDDVARKNLRQELWRIRKAISSQSPPDGDALVADEFRVVFTPPPQFWLDVEQLERASVADQTIPATSLDALLNAVALYRGELLPGFYDEWVILERDRVQAIFEARCGLALEQLIQTHQWKQAQEWAERWIALGQTPEPAYRALMLAAAAGGDSAKLAIAYERCVEALRNEVGVEPSSETRALFQQLSHGENPTAQVLQTTSPVLIQPSGTVTFLFTDIEGSTKLLERLGNEYATVLSDQRDILRAIAEKQNGHEVDTQGDAFFFAFFRAGDAVNFATEAQHALAAHPWQNGVRLRVRMGLHTGEPMLARTGYVGMDVHRAARIGGAGHGGQVLLSQTTSALVANELPNGTHLDDLGEHRLKDLRYPVHIVQLTMDDLPSDFPPLKVFDTNTEPPAPGEPPFKGLEFFDQNDANLFFGREQLVEKLTQTITDQNFLAVIIGASGSGKSSVVRAGLIPALKNQTAGTNQWSVFVMTPTAHPLESLATTLTRDSESVTATATLLDDLARDPRSLHLFLRRKIDPLTQSSVLSPQHLLVVDQFEELFTLCHEDFEREQFIDCLLDAVNVASGQGATRSRMLTLVLTIRADFYAHLAQYPELRDAVAKQQEYIGPMNTEELRRAMTEPATRGGWAFEPGLVDLILRDVGQEPGALPLLSHALLETWKRRSGHTLTLKGYADSGGVKGAISHTAESTYQQLTPEQQDIARNVFLRLTELGEGTEDTRRRATIRELEHGNWEPVQVRRVLTLLADARLITTGEHTAEVAHEALIREWTRLREWLNQDREGLKLHRHLTEAAHEWELMERDAGTLYRGARLAQAAEFAALNPQSLNAHERAFLDASLINEERETKERAAQQRRELDAAQKLLETQTRTTKQLRRRALFLTGAFLLALVLAGIAVFLGDQSSRNASAAEQNAAQAESNANAAESALLTAQKEKRIATARELAASAIGTLEKDPELSILLAQQAIAITKGPDNVVLPEAEDALHRSVQASHIFHTITANGAIPRDVAFSKDGKLLASNWREGKIRIHDVASGNEVFAVDNPPFGIDHFYFSEDGKELATVWGLDDQTLAAVILDVATGKAIKQTPIPVPPAQWWNSAYSPDWTRIAIQSYDAEANIAQVRVWDLETSKLLLTLPGGGIGGGDVAYSPDGYQIAAGWADNLVTVWDASSGKELHVLRGHTESITAVTYSADGKRIGTSSQDRTAKIWDAKTGSELLTLPSSNDWMTDISFSKDGGRIATLTLGHIAKLWDGTSGEELMTLAGHSAFTHFIDISPDGSRVATTSFDGTLRVWDTQRANEVLSVPTGGPISKNPFGIGTAAYSPDGKRIAVGMRDGRVKIWDVASGTETLILEGHKDAVHRIAFSPDGKRLASASSDGTAKIWDPETGKEMASLPGDTDTVLGVAWSSDGKQLATSSGSTTIITNGTIKLWDTYSFQLIATFQLPEQDSVPTAGFDVRFSPDGTRLAASTTKGSLAVWDLKTKTRSYALKLSDDGIFNVAFSPDGTRLAFASDQLGTKVLDAATGKELFGLKGIRGAANEVIYSPDGKMLATAGLDGTVGLWDATTGNELLTLYREDPNFAHGVAFSPDGTQIAMVGNKDLQIYFVHLDDLIALAKTRVTRSLTREECTHYLHVETCPQE